MVAGPLAPEPTVAVTHPPGLDLQIEAEAGGYRSDVTPEVVGEELLEMTNDIIDFVQKQAKVANKPAAKAKKAKK